MKKDDIKYNFIKMFLVMFAMVMMFSVDVKAAKLNKTSITLEKGKTYTLKMKDTKKKVTWKTKNKKVAKLSSKKRSSVKIKAVKTGKTYITGKVGKKTYKCKVTVVAPKKDNTTSTEEQTTESTDSTTETVTIDTEKKIKKYKVWMVTKWGSSYTYTVYVNKRSVIECTSCGYRTEDGDEYDEHEWNHMKNSEKSGYRVLAIWDSSYQVTEVVPEEGYWIEVEVGTYPEGLEYRDKEDAIKRLMKDTTSGQEFTPTEGYYYIDMTTK